MTGDARPRPGITVREGGLLSFLDEVRDGGDGAGGLASARGERGLCLLSGRIVARNLRERLAVDGRGPAPRTATVEGLATDVVAAAEGRPVRVLDRPVRKRIVRSVLATAADHDTPLGRFARRVPYEGEAVDEVVVELDEFHRCTDAGHDRAPLAAVVESVADGRPFGAGTTGDSVRAFAAIDRRLREIVGRSENGPPADGPDSGRGGRSAQAPDDRERPPRTFVARSHLVRTARQVLGDDASTDRDPATGPDVSRGDRTVDAWTAATGDPDWVAVATVSALDNPTLRLLLRIAEETPVVLLAGPGTADPFAERVLAAAAEVGVPARERSGGSWAVGGSAPGGSGSGGARAGEPAASLVAAARGGRPTVAPEGVRTVAVPDRRRAVEYAVRGARATGGETLLVAPDAGAYETPLRDVALSRDRPYRVETRRTVHTLPAFRALTATLELVAAAADGEAVPARRVVEPLRLGACPPAVGRPGGGEATGASAGADADVIAPDRWPLSGSAVRALAADLPRGERPVADWRAAVDDRPRVGRFLDWAIDRGESPPGDGRALQATLSGLLGAQVRALLTAGAGSDDDDDGAGGDGATGDDRSDRRPEYDRVDGIGVETGRALVAGKHPAWRAARVRPALAAAARAFDRLVDVGEAADWTTARAAAESGGAAESFGTPREDVDAVEVVDAGNAHFRRVDRTFVLGLSAGRFPRAARSPSFLHPAVREALARRRGDRPFLYLDGSRRQYERDLDAYRAALSTAREGVTLLYPYKDDDDRDLAPSPFLDPVEVPPDRRARVELGDWVAVGSPERSPAGQPRGGQSGDGRTGDGRADPEAWTELWTSLSTRERLRALARFANRPAAGGPDRAAVEDLASLLADPAVRRRVRRRAGHDWGDDDG